MIDFFLVPEAQHWYFPMLVRHDAMGDIADFALESLELLPIRLSSSIYANNVL